MFFLRIPLTLALILTLAGAPALRALAMSTPTSGDASMHAAHHGSDQDSASGPASLSSLDSSASSCAQHESCDGQCCVSCAQCVTALTGLPPTSAAPHAVLTPFSVLLAFTHFPSERERPPRAFPV